MELPDKLKGLYRHWPLHIVPNAEPLAPSEIFFDPELFDELSWFVRERLAIWEKKAGGEAPPYTKDPILATYRFCNIFREFDLQTVEYHELLDPIREDFPLWLLNMFYCRMVARPETVRSVGLLSFDTEENLGLYERLMDSPRPRYGTPYVFPVSTIQRGPTPTRELFITEHLPEVMRSVAKEITNWESVSVYDGVKRVLPLFGYELSFHWTEVLIDTAYQFPHYLDLYKRFPVGPGAAPTMARIDSHKDPAILAVELARLPFDTGLTIDAKPLVLSAENWEGIACEFRKYTNLKQGTGRHRLFAGGRSGTQDTLF